MVMTQEPGRPMVAGGVNCSLCVTVLLRQWMFSRVLKKSPPWKGEGIWIDM